MIELYLAGCGYREVDYILQSLKLNRLMSYLQPSKKLWIEMSEVKMDIYFSGSRSKRQDNEIFKLNKNFLASFSSNNLGSILKIVKNVKSKSKFFVDSGAFTTWTKGKEVDVDKYIHWLNENDKHLTIFGQVDCIPGKPGFMASAEEREIACQKTFENYMYMIRRLKSPEKCLYTFHCHENYKYLEEFLDNKFLIEGKEFKPSYMALGGMGNADKTERLKFLDTCFAIIKQSNNPEIKVHVFGVTSFDILQYYPQITSVDSTTWLMVAAMGSIITENGTLYISSLKKDTVNIDNNTKNNILRYGFSLEQLANDTVSRCLYNALWMEEKVRNLVFKRKIKLNNLF